MNAASHFSIRLVIQTVCFLSFLLLGLCLSSNFTTNFFFKVLFVFKSTKNLTLISPSSFPLPFAIIQGFIYFLSLQSFPVLISCLSVTPRPTRTSNLSVCLLRSECMSVFSMPSRLKRTSQEVIIEHNCNDILVFYLNILLFL